MKIELPKELHDIAKAIGAQHIARNMRAMYKIVDGKFYTASRFTNWNWECVGNSEFDPATHHNFFKIDLSETKDELRAEIKRLKSALGKQWLPIDTAPTDGTNVLVLLKSGSVMQAEFWDFWMPVYFSSTKIEPTHWQPLPPSPEK